jgi:cobalt-precorrin-5B (C1)-methyltransferase
MITQAVREVTDRGLRVVIAVPDGEKRAKKTTNARLGILGGISILGTTGIVRPFSTESWRASVVQAVSVMAAQGLDTLVLCTGGRTEKGAMAMLPALPETCFVEVGDFTGAALTKAKELGLTSVVFVGMPGKLTKLASGVVMTHYTKSKVDLSVLAELTPEPLREQVAAANTARHAYELWAAAGLARECGDALCAQVADVLHRWSGLEAKVALVDPEGAHVVAATEPEWIA